MKFQKFTIQTGTDNPILRSPADPILPSEYRHYAQLGEEMVKHVKKDDIACGLAAPQIGVSKRLIAVSLMHDREDEGYKTIFMMNPRVLKSSPDTEVDQEGCLSVPEEYGYVERSREIRLEYTDGQGRTQLLILSGFVARIVLHEIDHLDGILFIDRIAPEARIKKSKKPL